MASAQYRGGVEVAGRPAGGCVVVEEVVEEVEVAVVASGGGGEGEAEGVEGVLDAAVVDGRPPGCGGGEDGGV
ncbi:hypothetical protein [Streptomyces poonensis]|uniref:hypothetical protein n=1 Tax=Streptomyces poonensis TaxID=68255 RepID=UPI00167747EC|nr:hypothetical protein [Streptomyces poonensis]